MSFIVRIEYSSPFVFFDGGNILAALEVQDSSSSRRMKLC